MTMHLYACFTSKNSDRILERAAQVYDCWVYDCWCMSSILASQLEFAWQSSMTICVCMTIIGREHKALCAAVHMQTPLSAILCTV